MILGENVCTLDFKLAKTDIKKSNIIKKAKNMKYLRSIPYYIERYPGVRRNIMAADKGNKYGLEKWIKVLYRMC